MYNLSDIVISALPSLAKGFLITVVMGLGVGMAIGRIIYNDKEK